MLRVHLMQHWFTLSDPGMEDALYEIESMRRFADIERDIEWHAIPGESTILNFRRLTEDNDLCLLIFGKVNQHLSRKGLLLKIDTMVDTNIWSWSCQPRSIRNGSIRPRPSNAIWRMATQVFTLLPLNWMHKNCKIPIKKANVS
jgi:IS5 family transposase